MVSPPLKYVLELCAGAGGQSLGLELAGFELAAAVEIDKHACATLRMNRPDWDVREEDLCEFNAKEFEGVDLVAAGVPCPPFSMAGKQLGADDERDLFPEALRVIRAVKPRAILLENVRGFAAPKFDDYRKKIISRLKRMGYTSEWKVLQASDFGVPQLRPRFVLVGFRSDTSGSFEWPLVSEETPTSVGEALVDLMSEDGWGGAKTWAKKADRIAPTLVGGSKKHGGPDLGPTRAKKAWLEIGVDGMGIANEPPTKLLPKSHIPRLTVRMAARIQGFSDDWEFSGKKTNAYRQVGNAFPPPVAEAVGRSIISVLDGVPALASK